MKHIIVTVFILILTALVPMAYANAEVQNTDAILDLNNPPEFVTERKMTDEEILKLTDCSLDTLKEKISTYGDFIAWTRIALFNRVEFYNMEATNEETWFTFGAQYAYSLIGFFFTPNMTVSIAQYVLEDDIPGIGRLFILLKADDSEVHMLCANYIPADGGFYILNAELFLGADSQKLDEACNLNHMIFVSDMTEFIRYLCETYPSNPPEQIMAFDTSDTVVLYPVNHWYVPQDPTHVRNIYSDLDIVSRPVETASDSGSAEALVETASDSGSAEAPVETASDSGSAEAPVETATDSGSAEVPEKTENGKTEAAEQIHDESKTDDKAAGEQENDVKVLDPENLPAFFTERKLTDEQIAGIGKIGLDDLRKQISTYGDLAAWVKIQLFPKYQFSWLVTSGDDWQLTFGAEFSYSWLIDWFSPNMTVSIAQYVLGDDYPGIGTVCVFIKDGSNVRLKCANYIPWDDGLYIANPEVVALGNDFWNLGETCAFDCLLHVSSLTDIPAYYRENRPWEQIIQVMALDDTDSVSMDLEDFQYVPRDMTHVDIIYFDEDAKYPSNDEKVAYDMYNFPKQLSIKSEINADAAREIKKGTYEDAAARIKTLPDVMNYLFYTGHSVYGSNLSVVRHDGEWCYNLKPKVVFRRGKGNCGGTSGLIAGLLEGDYDEVGMIYMRFPAEGHVINYIRDGALYYVFDGNSWIGSNYGENGLSFSYAGTLKEAAMKYSQRNGALQMVAYTNPRGGDCPVMLSGNATKLPNHYCEFTILQESPEEGSTFIMVDYDPVLFEAIDLIRDTW